MKLESSLLKIQEHFHAVIRNRAGDLIEKHQVDLPDITSLAVTGNEKQWFPIPGMYGGFSYWIDAESEELRLISESWCRVVGGSGQRHIVTAEGSVLDAEGFV